LYVGGFGAVTPLYKLKGVKIMQITLSFDNFTELPYTSGTIQNISSQATVEICQDDTANTGLILGPGEWFSWSNSTVYARSAWDYEPVARCAVVPFKKGGEGGGSEYILPVATKTTLGGVKSSDEAGAIKVDSFGKMTYNAPSSTPLSAPDWETNTAYPENALVEYGDNIYICLTAHTSGTFADDLANGKWKLVSMTLTAATSSELGGVKSNSADGGVTVASDGKMTINLPKATSSTLGGVKIGDGLSVTADGTLSATSTGGGISVWQANTDYEVNDVVVDDNLIWQCVVAHTSTSTFDESKWEEISGGGIFAWKSNKNYKVGIMVVYKYCMYMCKVAHTSTSEFDYSKWIIIGGNGNSDFGDYVGHITWQMTLQSNYLKLDGTPLADASSDYDELLKFAQDNNLITADTTDKSLFKYDTTTDVLTLPDYIGLCLQGGSTVEEKEAGLPNIMGSTRVALHRDGGGYISSSGAFSGATQASGAYAAISGAQNPSPNGTFPACNLLFSASKSNSIYGASNTVQPPAITLIPQIRYKYSGITYSTEEQRIGTWIDGKPLYRKVFDNPTLPLDTGLISTNYTVRHIDGMAHDGDSIIKLPHSDYSEGYNFIYDGAFTASTGIFTVRQVNMSSAILDYLTIEYTKN
jgi:hypothetical protein